jgi:cytoskeleton protein RodZ
VTDDVPPTGRSAPSAGGGASGGPTPGATLAAQRERAGLSVEDVAAETRIRATVVRAIERDDYTPCGGEVYARGHLRAIAHTVGADAGAVVAAFDQRFGRQPPKLSVTPISTIGEPVREVTRKATKTAPKWPAAAIAVLALVVVLLAVSWVVGRSSETGTPRAGATGAPPASSTATPSTGTSAPSTSEAPPPTTSKPVPAGITVRVAITGESSWVRVRSSTGQEIYQGILAKGQMKDFHDPTALSLRFGNAQVVELTVNGTKVGKPCAKQVCDQTYPTDRTQAG